MLNVNYHYNSIVSKPSDSSIKVASEVPSVVSYAVSAFIQVAA